MLTVKKFGAMFDLSIGGYVAGVIGIILALLTIIVFPPDMDLQGKSRQAERFQNRETWKLFCFNFLDDPDGNLTKIVETTVATILESTTDDDIHDDDQPIADAERKDETNDSKANCCENFTRQNEESSSSTT